jgi:hypothetical protein
MANSPDTQALPSRSPAADAIMADSFMDLNEHLVELSASSSLLELAYFAVIRKVASEVQQDKGGNVVLTITDKQLQGLSHALRAVTAKAHEVLKMQNLAYDEVEKLTASPATFDRIGVGAAPRAV